MYYDSRITIIICIINLNLIPSIQVTNSGPAKRGTVRLFIAPKYDERGLPWLLTEQRLMMVELDRYVTEREYWSHYYNWLSVALIIDLTRPFAISAVCKFVREFRFRWLTMIRYQVANCVYGSVKINLSNVKSSCLFRFSYLHLFNILIPICRKKVWKKN